MNTPTPTPLSERTPQPGDPAPAVLRALGWDRLAAALAGEAHSEIAYQALVNAAFATDVETARAAYARTGEAQRLAESRDGLPPLGFDDIRPAVILASKGGVLDAEPLIACAHACDTIGHAATYFVARAHEAPLLAEEAVPCQPTLSALARRLLALFDPTGNLHDSASPELRALRASVRDLTSEIKARMGGLQRDAVKTGVAREDYFTVRNGRYVLPIRAEFKHQYGGIIHDASQTGQTVFIEPEALVPIGNRLKIAEAQTAAEERRILAEASLAVGERAQAILEGLGAVATIDTYAARAHLGHRLQGIIPDLTPSGLSLHRARHPQLVLDGRAAIPNDIILAPGCRGMIVSGPNAGGKSVTLKTAGLIALLARAGIPIPAAPGSAVAIYPQLFAAFGDAQDLHEGLSTFSGHVKVLNHILQHASADSLVLLDEIGTDTDPQEGAALAVAVLERLADGGATAIASTHYAELRALALHDDRFVNTSVGYDAETYQPTYRLEYDTAGQSLAIAVAARLGMDAELIARARGLLGENRARLAELAEHLNRLRGHLAEREAAVEAERQDLETRLASLTQREREVREHHERGLVETRAQALREIEAARRQAAEIIAQLQRAESPDMRAAVQSQAAIAAVAAAQAAALQSESARAASAGHPAVPLAIGAQARVRTLGVTGIVTALDGKRGRAEIEVNGRRIVTTPADLVGIAGPAPKPHGPRHTAPEAPETPLEIDVRGEYPEDAVRKLEAFLDQALQAHAQRVRVIHGHGTGALRRAIRAYLAHSPYAGEFAPAGPHEGGEGATYVHLRD